MFPRSYFADSFFPPNFWPKGAGVSAGRGAGAIGRRRMWQMMEQQARNDNQRRSYRTTVRAAMAPNAMPAETDAARMSRAVATYAVLLSEV